MTRKEKKKKKTRIYSNIPFYMHKELQSETASFNQLQVLHKLHRGSGRDRRKFVSSINGVARVPALTEH